MEQPGKKSVRQPARVLCPSCPKCGCPAPFIFETFAQAFCIDDNCDVLAWNPWATAAANLADMAPVTFEEIPLRETARDE